MLPGRVWVCGRSAGRSDSCASREPPLQDWLDNWQPRGTPCGPISSLACKPHLMMPARVAGVRVPLRPTPPWPTSSPASRTTRGKDHPWARLSGPGTGQVWHRVQELAGRARKRLPRRSANRDARSLPGIQERHCLACSNDATSVLDACHIVTLAGDAPGEVRCRVQQDTTGHRGRKGDPLLPNPASPAPGVIGSRSVNKNDSVRPSRQMRHTMSVEVADHFAQHVRDVLPPSHTRPRPMPGRSSH